MARRSSNSNRPVRPSSTPAKRKGIPLSPLAQQMAQDLHLAGRKERTHEAYLRAVRKFAQWLNKSPDQASENDLRRYLLFIKNDQHWEGIAIPSGSSLARDAIPSRPPPPRGRWPPKPSRTASPKSSTNWAGPHAASRLTPCGMCAHTTTPFRECVILGVIRAGSGLVAAVGGLA
jgi:hypothetical protein